MDEGPETGDADSVVAAVRAKVLAVLEAEAPRLSRLAPGESAVVAVDFVPRRPGASAARRTVVWRARKQDLEARAAGRLAPEEFRRRVAISEY
jgi:hypothetical protein